MKTIISRFRDRNLPVLFFSFFFLYCSTNLVAQSNSETLYLSDQGLNKLVFKKFAALNNGGSTSNSMVSYASLDPLNGKASFNCTAPLGRKAVEQARISLLSLKVSGDLLSDNSIVLFKDAKINTNLGFDGQFHWSPKTGVSTRMTNLGSSRVRLNQVKKSIQDQRKLDSLNWLNDTTHLKKVQAALKDLKIKNQTKISDLNKTISTLEGLGKVQYSDSIIKCLSKIKELEGALNKIDVQVDSIGYLIQEEISFNGKLLEDRLAEKYQKKLIDAESNPSFTKLSFWWLTLDGGFSRKEYHSFFRDSIFQKQIAKNDFYTYKLGVSFNYFREGTNKRLLSPEGKPSFYFNIGVMYQKDNNTSLLKTTEISEERVFKNAAGDTTRKITEKYNAYTDSIITDDIVSVNTNFYWTHPSKAVSFHLFPSINSYVGGKTLVSLGVGVLASFKNAKKDQPALNTELYIQILDLFNELDRSSDLWSSSQIGIRFSHSFNFFN